MGRKVYDHLLSILEINPVLFDIGASGAPPKIWDPIARHSIYVGFDPDLREMQRLPEKYFYRSIILNEAITPREGSDDVVFYLTKYPQCSSTLRPDITSLSNYLFSDLFVVEQETLVRASTVESIMDRFALSHIHWFKTDSQGTDLRIFNSLNEKVRRRVLAVDMEPGLISAYVEEDLFVDVHRDLMLNGFWLSNMKIGGAVRLRRSSLSSATRQNERLSETLIDRGVRKSPAWCETRYLRTIESLTQDNFTKQDYVLLWIFALLDDQPGFALDLATEYEYVFGRNDVSELMKNESISHMRRSWHRRLFSVAKALLPVQVKRRLGTFIP